MTEKAPTYWFTLAGQKLGTQSTPNGQAETLKLSLLHLPPPPLQGLHFRKVESAARVGNPNPGTPGRDAGPSTLRPNICLLHLFFTASYQKALPLYSQHV